ncbi:M56 family metallopeptidase [Chiayiivirga flava]|uniref:Beta-lactamase regulating signal transducer with metallopeptidase domain n=1 Tax=Chiayiivirga flava TaxID=659595 RepID=A0A7W8D809_9GAMM|nr:M56 family metallopeptidase [Chiayiivirga flava]MBB5209292.1 beta-lactamase regulating signal transducer with metallopeptidase domain [Chiayiivirga flava]
MAADLLQILWNATLALTIALVLVLLMRVPLRRLGGAAVLRWPWAAVPLAPAAALLPARTLEPAVVQAPALHASFDAMPSVASAAGGAIEGWSIWLLAAWAVGSAACALLCVRQQRRFERLLGGLQHADDGTWRAQSCVGTPALLGVLSPRIVLPADFDERFTPIERELALAHERAHRDARDTRIAAIAATLRCVFWFHPLVHVAARCLRLDLEYACDATVLAAHPQHRRSYAEALVKAQPGPLLPLGCHWDAGRPLLARVRQLAAPLPGAKRLGVARAVAALLVLLATTTAWALQPGVPTDGDARWIEAHVSLKPRADFGVSSPAAAEPARVIVRSGGTFAVRMGEDGAIWEVTGVPRFDGTGRIHLDVQLLRGGELEMSSSDSIAPGQTLALRSAAADDGVGATATITVWPARDAAVPREQEPATRVTGRMRIGVDGRGDTSFFDHGVDEEREAHVADAGGLRVFYRVTALSATQATIAFRIEQRRDDGSTFILSTPTLVVERGTDAGLRIDVPADSLKGAATAARQLDARLTIDPA